MNFKKTAISGLFFSAVDIVFAKGLMFIATLFMAKMLGPEQFGLIGMIAVFLTLGTILVDSGFSASLIRTKNTDNRDYSTIFITNIATSLVIYAAVYLGAPAIANFYEQPVLTDIIRVYSLNFIITAFSTTYTAVCIKQLQFKKIMAYNIPSNIIGISIGVIMGREGYGVWSIVAMYLSSQLSYALIIASFSEWKPSLHFSWKLLKRHFNFGYKLMLSSILNTVFDNIYNVLFGKFFSLKVTGFYERAKIMNEYPVVMLSGLLNKVMYPMLSQLQDERAIVSAVYKKMIQVTFFLAAPCMLFAAALAKPLFLVILGSQWLPAVPFFQILCFGSMLYPIHVFNINLLQVYGRSDLFLKLEVIKKVVILIAVLITFRFGVYALLAGSVCTSFIALGINSYYSKEIIDYPLRKQMMDLIPTLLISLFSALLISNVDVVFGSLLIIPNLLISFSLGLLIYIGLHYFFNTVSFNFFINLLKPS